MKTNNFDLFEMYLVGLKESLADPIRFAFEKTGERLDCASFSAEEMVFAADGGVYLAVKDLLLTAGTLVQVEFESFELAELVEADSGVAIWFATQAVPEDAPAFFTVPAFEVTHG